MVSLQDFFNNARDRNLCKAGAKLWGQSKNKKSLIDIALSSWGCDYVATAIQEGWGISPETIAEEFSSFNNGRYTRVKDGYTSQLFCQTTAETITIETTLTLIIGFFGKIIIPDDRPCELYIVDSAPTIIGASRAVIHSYGSRVRTDGENDITLNNN